MNNKTSSRNVRLKYLMPSCWIENQFWESSLYSEKSKEYFRLWLSRILKDEKKLTAIEKNIGK